MRESDNGHFHLPESPQVPPAAVRAMKMIEQLGQALAGEEIATLYRENLHESALQIGRRYFDQETIAMHPGIVEDAVLYALKTSIPPTEYAELVERHKAEYIKRRRESGYYQSEEFLTRTEKAREPNRQRHKRMSPEDKRKIRKVCLEAQGKYLWEDDEKEMALRLVTHPDFLHSNGSKPKPDYAKIADELNRVFHNGQEIRTSGNVSSNVRFWRYIRRKASRSN